MKHIHRLILTVLIIASLQLAACAPSSAEPTPDENGPVKVEHLEGLEPTRVTLTADAAKRLDIQTAPVRGVGAQMAIPYAAVLYDTQGNTWVYTNPETLAFVRSPITVDHIEGDQAFLSAGPPSDSVVVIVGAAELYGSETEFEEE